MATHRQSLWPRHSHTGALGFCQHHMHTNQFITEFPPSSHIITHHIFFATIILMICYNILCYTIYILYSSYFTLQTIHYTHLHTHSYKYLGNVYNIRPSPRAQLFEPVSRIRISATMSSNSKTNSHNFVTKP